MRKALRRRSALFACLLGGLCGLALYLLVFGIHTLDVTNDAWLLGGGDLTQHYLGWMFYREGGWAFPPGLGDRMAYPYEVSVSFTDSIPLLAMFFKLFHPVLPATFQYLGLFACGSYVLVGGLGALLVWRITSSLPLAALGGGLLVLTPVLLHRTLAHTALGGQWLLLAPLVFWAYEDRWQKLWQRLVFWCGLLVLCAWVHPYFIPMVLALQAAWAANWVLFRHGATLPRRLGKAALCVLGAVAAGLCALWFTGAFASGMGVETGDLGVYSFPLNGFWNDSMDYSRLWPAFGFAPGQGEGYAYLGLGVFLLCGAAAVLVALRLLRAARVAGVGGAARAGLGAVPGWAWCVLAACLLLVGLAVGPVVTWGGRVLFRLPYPALLERVLGIFRCTGRFVWPVCYLLPLGAVWLLHRLGTKRLLGLLLAAAVCLQGVELTRGMAVRGGEVRAEHAALFPYSDAGWEILAETVEHLVVQDEEAAGQYGFAWYAAAHGLTINKAHFARYLPETARTAPAYCAALASGTVREDTALVCPAGSGWAVGLPLTAAGLYIYEFDGWAVILGRELAGLGGAPTPGDGLANGPLDVLEALPTKLYLAEGHKDGIHIAQSGDVRGQCLPLPAGRYRATYSGEGLQAEHCKVYSAWLGGALEAEVGELPDGFALELVLEEAAPDMEFWVENPFDTDMVLWGIELEKLA